MDTNASESKYFYFVDYVNYKGGVNNLQVAKIYREGMRGGYVKCFTSQKDKAESRAQSWIRKEDKEELRFEKMKEAGAV